MIQSWKSKALQAVLAGRTPKGFPADLAEATRRGLFRLEDATSLDDLRTPRGNRLPR